ncbi:AfsR/SARP family transcriptional regulator [Micromonospora sp. NPDC047548]|uniref:AfsR/SARP family transcriptional regulator n=1 Tax=Micromonospora sp. NPDC047548 TaxID=3155624 RepID=UPI0033E3357A
MAETHASQTLNFGLLGPVRAWLGNAELNLGSPQQRTILVMLLLREGAVATLGELIEGMWGYEPPRSAVTTVRTYMSRLRRVLSELSPDAPARIDSVYGGYILHTTREMIDVNRFSRHTARGAEAAGRNDWGTARAELNAALELWRGQPLAGTFGPYVAGQRLRLQQLVAAARVDFLRAMVGLGRYGEVLPELTSMAAADPLREDVQGLLMTALHGSGRVAEALQHYQKTRRALIDDLGLEPGVQLRAIHQSILAGESTTASSHPVTEYARPHTTSPNTTHRRVRLVPAA